MFAGRAQVPLTTSRVRPASRGWCKSRLATCQMHPGLLASQPLCDRGAKRRRQLRRPEVPDRGVICRSQRHKCGDSNICPLHRRGVRLPGEGASHPREANQLTSTVRFSRGAIWGGVYQGVHGVAKKAARVVGGWLFKEEPDHYSFADLERDGSTVWDGVVNALARQHLRTVKPGDRVLYYHSGNVRAIVGEMRVTEGPAPDPTSDDPKAVVVKLEPVKRWTHPVTLAQVKADESLATWDLVRLPRLSVMPVSAEQWRRVEEIANSP
jgi:predicted RNA-binding protein with PUA-like domain